MSRERDSPEGEWVSRDRDSPEAEGVGRERRKCSSPFESESHGRGDGRSGPSSLVTVTSFPVPSSLHGMRGGHARPKRLSATCNEAEYGRREALRAADSALRDANAARNSLPLTRIHLEPQWHLGVCVRTRVTIAR